MRVNLNFKKGTNKKMILFLLSLLLTPITLTWAEEIAYRKHIKPLFESKCLGCHGPDSAPEYYSFKEDKDLCLSKGKRMRMDTYSHLIFYTAWPDTGALMRRLDDGKNTKDGKPGNMYQHLGSTEEERQQNLKLFKEWVGNWILKRWKEITKDNMDGIKVKY